jgi:hypothetical protein
MNTSKIYGVRTVDFYPKGMSVPGSIDAAGGNVSNLNLLSQENGGVGGSGALPALWWLGIVIVLVALRLIYEYS